jgi:hypothetical protein
MPIPRRPPDIDPEVSRPAGVESASGWTADPLLDPEEFRFDQSRPEPDSFAAPSPPMRDES